MADAADRIADLLSAPLEQLIVALGSGIGRSQAELDRHTIATQAMIDEHPVLSQYGIEATWYQIPTTELELHMAISMEAPPEAERAALTGERAGEPLPLALPEGLKALPRLWAQPVNPRLRNQFGFDVQASSRVKLSVVAVPPPGQAVAATPQAPEAEIRELARPYLRPTDDLTQPPEGRVTVNFNPGARAWFVIQSLEVEGVPQLLVLLKLDDETRQVLRHEVRQ